MVIIGAGGFAKQLLEVITLLDLQQKVVFFDNLTEPPIQKLFNRFTVVNKIEEIRLYFLEHEKQFVLGVGNPRVRAALAAQFVHMGGQLVSLYSPKCTISAYDVAIGNGTCILSGCFIEGNVSIGEGCLINVGSMITHDSVVGDYTEIGPGVRICGQVNVGDFCSVGTGAILIPKIKIGSNVVVAAGSVVTQNIPDNVMVAGVPAVIKKVFK